MKDILVMHVLKHTGLLSPNHCVFDLTNC